MKNILVYEDKQHKQPFYDWLIKLDSKNRARIIKRLDRLKNDYFGDCKGVGSGVYELRCHFGSGYRIYYGLGREEVVLLLSGGDKSTQGKDIKKSIQYWRHYNER